MTSMAWVPIDPVEPTRLTVFTGRLPDDVEQRGEVVRDRQGQEDGVETVQKAAMAEEGHAGVLDAQVTLDHRLEQVARRRSQTHDQTEPQAVAHAAPGRQLLANDGADNEGGDEPADETFHRFAGADACLCGPGPDGP